MLFISITLCYICLFEFIRVEWGLKSKKIFKGGGEQAIDVWKPLMFIVGVPFSGEGATVCCQQINTNQPALLISLRHHVFPWIVVDTRITNADVPQNAMKAFGGTGSIAPTHSLPRL
jgi:hypothetical protein